jgi:opacity protein-like surface antigen/outer membrane protein OmpA-like peptidoglycan-associated protein
MKLSVRMIATAAFAIFLMPAILLRAGEAAKPSTGANDGMAADSSALFSLWPAAPMPSASTAAAMPYSEGLNRGTPKVEWFLGYSYLRGMPDLEPANRLYWLNGGSMSIAYNFNRYLGLVADLGGFADSKIEFPGTGGGASTVMSSYGAVFPYLFGPRLSFRGHERVTPFLQVLFGGIYATKVMMDSGCGGAGCIPLPAENKFAWTGGGGLDVKVSHHVAIRIVQVEYLMTNFQNHNTGINELQNDMRFSSGIVFRFGGNPGPQLPPPSPLAYSCSVNPSSVFPGDTISVSGTALNLNPAKTAAYTWSVDGGVVSGVSSTAKIDTTNLAPGAYTLKGHVSVGDRPSENADCTAPYAVKAYEPPTVSCSANPSAVISGDSSTITAIGISPQNRPLTYSYSSTSGLVNGTGTTAALSTTGATVGTVTVTCNVADDKGQTASGATSVMVSVPAVVAKPQTSELCSINFERDVARPSRVDNEAKACLDEIALNLQRSSDAKLAVVGSAATGEKGGKKLAAARAVNTKAYLVSEKGIDASRISVYTGSEDGKTVSTTLIPAGATLNTSGNIPVE